MITVTGKVCILSAVFMIGLVVLWLCHVCCRNIWNFILVRLDSSSRFSRILELSEINRERLRILPTTGGPMTQLAFLTTYVSSPARPHPNMATHTRNLNRTRSVRSNGLHQNGSATLIGPNNRPITVQRLARPNERTQSNFEPALPVIEPIPPPCLSIDSGSEQTLCADPYQSVTLTIASANSPPPSYHSTESIVSQPTSAQTQRIFREFPRQTSDSSETSVKSAPSAQMSNVAQLRCERLQRIMELNASSVSSSSSGDLSNPLKEVMTSATLTAVACTMPNNGEPPPSYEDLFGSSSSSEDMSSPDV
uniref:Uncharacterized protein n=1 Tax=Strigamia maritima TaxID=126957 RepID=T1IQ00_STRMM